MRQSKLTEEQITMALRQAEAAPAQGICRKLGRRELPHI